MAGGAMIKLARPISAVLGDRVPVLLWTVSNPNVAPIRGTPHF
jgi:hypothetical protein